MTILQEELEGLVEPPREKTAPPVVLFATAVGVIITNLFAPQTMAGAIGGDFGLTASSSGLAATITLVGYSSGLFLLVPLADIFENRKLVMRMLACAATAATGIGLAPSTWLLFVLMFVLGAACSAIQILVPIAASMASPESRGRVIGDVMGGLMVGILLARPAASFLADLWGWRAFYFFSAGAIALLAVLLAVRLPERRPDRLHGYGALIASLWHLLATERVLRRRALSAALVMAAFNLFWTSVAFLLQRSPFALDQTGIAVFALVGAGGAAVTPVVGRLSDRGLGGRVTIFSHVLMVLGFAVAAWAGSSNGAPTAVLLAFLGAGAVLLDVGVTGDQTVGRHAINHLRPEARGRINGLFVGIFFIGGAVGSAASGFLWTAGGWPLTCLGGALFGLAAFLFHVVTRRA
ncbi:MFS transporter [Rhizobium deserti]|uniref:MFS transporter n=1 Tax=Rhizobium deserti TaxID=2547961 RepID=A0A4R5UMV9_9HYPH|nr:MFS transporter [Rhizobium deserti]TDK39237.1 MFS transporter [Rhizobium deserti]